MAKRIQYHGVGRRKSSVARVYLTKGKGDFTVNKLGAAEYFDTPYQQTSIRNPLKAVDKENAYDIFVNVKGGGKSGQADAISLGIARALLKVDEKLRAPLRKNNLLTRDSRIVERKKYGQKGARKKFQFSKR